MRCFTIYFCKTLYMFQTVFPSIIRSSKLHIQRQAFVRPILLPAASLARLVAGRSIPHQNRIVPRFSPPRATFPAYLILLDFITRIAWPGYQQVEVFLTKIALYLAFLPHVLHSQPISFFLISSPE